MQTNALVLSGWGTNCERETEYALHQGGFDSVDVVHMHRINELNLLDYQLIVFGGGFMDGDDLGGAKACANRFRYGAEPVLPRIIDYINNGRLVLGICNGFQLLLKLGLLPKIAPEQATSGLTLAPNRHGRYENRWVDLSVNPDSPCVFTKGLTHMQLPIRHGEGRIIGLKSTLDEISAHNQIVMQYSQDGQSPTMDYPFNPNGSVDAIAAVCNARGTVMGLMPHPEAYNQRTNHPQWGRTQQLPPLGVELFANAHRFCQQQLSDSAQDHPPETYGATEQFIPKISEKPLQPVLRTVQGALRGQRRYQR